MTKSSFLKLVREKGKQKLLFLPHAIDQMIHPERLISREEVSQVVFNGEIIEEYPADRRGPSCLMYKYFNRAIHVVCAPKNDYLAIITAYIPDPNEWETDFKKRK
jgi:hypothetical protein